MVNCDKCGKPVPIKNDATQIDLLITGNPVYLLANPRHLLPTDDCEGSPSRAQYLPDQPLDNREYVYDIKFGVQVRNAYFVLQTQTGN